jgi:penicillin amidase
MKIRYAAIVFLIIFSVPVLGTGQTSTAKVILPDLESEVTVRRDARGIPYIEARSDADLYFAQGYVTASDRLWQMDLLRRVARGETAEIFGERSLESDKHFRRFGFAEVANQSLGSLTPQLRAALNAYAGGVNAYIASLDEKSLPIEFQILKYRPRQWTPSDTIAVGKILADALSTTWQNDLLRASLRAYLTPDKFADLTNQVTPYDVVLFGSDTPAKIAASSPQMSIPPELLAFAERDANVRAQALAQVGLYAEELAASNNWVISGKRTADGRPILANDPHIAASTPGIWYLTHLSTPDMRVSGVTFPGVPGIVLGHNESIAWGATNVGPDVQDLYLETFNDKGEVKTPTGWEAARVRKEQIRVRTSFGSTETKAVDFDVTETRNGVIVTDEGGKKYSLKWTARDPKNSEFEVFFELDRAKDWNGFKDALRTYGGATQNFVYADVKGNIGWYAAGKIPIRRTGDGAYPYDGATNDGDWTGYIPFEELPNLYNPPEGLIVTANQRIVGTDYKYTQMSRDAAPPWRARRIFDSLRDKKRVTQDDVRDVQYDVYNIPLANLSKEIVKDNAASAETLDVLKSWDGRMTPESRGALMANEIRGCLAGKIADANRPAPAFLIRERILDTAVRERSPRWLPAGFASYDKLFRSCDGVSRASLAERLGTDPAKWTWGSTWQSRFPHPLAAAPFIGAQFATPIQPISGSGQTPNVGSNVSMRHITSPGNWDATRHVIPMGESGDPRSPHYKDEFEAWSTGTPMLFPFSKAAVEKAAADVVVLSPR